MGGGVVCVHRDLVASGHFGVVVALARVFDGEAGTQRVHVEEGVFTVCDVGDGGTVEGLVACVADSWEVHPRAFFFDFNSLESTDEKEKFKTV